MKTEMIEVYCGNGKGKTTLALGGCMRAALQGQSVIVIQFLKGKERKELDFLDEMDIGIKLFRFEKSQKYYQDLSEEEKQEQNVNIINGLNFARKVIVTQECDLLVLDEILGLIDLGIVTAQEVIDVLKARDDSMRIILTGTNMDNELKEIVDSITTISTEKTKQ
ncbi:MAG: cob(I)yrinic acid a,c-diamide adenosyltransferase [Lachnospiraceae bacterium]